MEMKLDVECREVIKPNSPTPHEHLQLSIFDFICPGTYVSTIFFYKTEDESPDIISEKLKKSLSETLTRFYPLAGRIEGLSINCNDEGAMFIEAHTDLLLPDFLRNNLNTESLESFLPTKTPGDSPTEWPLMSVKATFFGSGSGVAITVTASHRLCDVTSLLALAMDLAATTAKEKSKVSSTIQFAETTIYPPPLISFQPPPAGYNLSISRKCVMNRFVFESSKIAELKRKAASENVLVPTRVEAITSLFWRCARNASRSNLVAAVGPRSTMMFQPMDLRLRIPSMENAIGNLQTILRVKEGGESELEIPETVAALRKAKEGINQMIKENVQGNTLSQSLLSQMRISLSGVTPKIDNSIDMYTTTSWCRKPLYKVDFGWGSPVWLGYASHAIDDNVVYAVLIDSKDGESIEAWINLPEEDMSVLVGDQEFLSYAVLNPPVII